MAKDQEKLMIIDGNALIHRSFHALPPTMATKDGEPTNAVYGFALVLFKAISEFKPDYVALTMDIKGPTFRHKKYPAYKGTRIKAPAELYRQIPLVEKLAAALGIPVYKEAGYEADDLIGTIAARTDDGVKKIIVTGDLDTLQLVDSDTAVYTMSRGLSDSVLYDEAAVAARFGLAASQMVDYKALRGDPSDNIPGVKGIGEKTAAELLVEYKTLDNLYLNLEKAGTRAERIKPRIAELLKKHKSEAYLSRELGEIRRDVKIDFDLARARFGDFDREKAAALLSELEFKSLLPRLSNLAGSRSVALSKEERAAAARDKFVRNRRDYKYKFVRTEKDFSLFLSRLNKREYFTFDTETSSFDPLTADLLGVSFSWTAGEAYFINMRKLKDANENNGSNLFNYKSEIRNQNSQIVIHPWIRKLKPVMENEKIKKYGHNIKFDLAVMRAAGLNVRGAAFDTMIASYLLNPGSRQHNLDAVVFAELGFDKISKDDLLGKGRDKIGFADVEAENLSLYSCEDADFTNRLVKKLGAQLKAQKLDNLFKEIEMPLVPVLVLMEENGILIDKKILLKISKKIRNKLETIEKNIYREAGVKFNINSTKQLRDILFEKLDLPRELVTRTKTGLSTAADELNKLKEFHPVIGLIQTQRELVKLLNTYVDALPHMTNRKTGRLHTSFNQTITATGRLSSTEPNLQNIPIRTELGREIRRAFVAADGQRLVGLDYSQIELRLAAHMSGDRKMIKAFKDGADIHAATAAEINSVALSAVTKEQRREAKAVNFGILYGQGPHGLSQTADIPYARAKEFIDHYFDAYPGIKKYIAKTVDQARTRGFAETLFGRRRYLPDIASTVAVVRKAAERMAVNTPLQGTAADMIKAAMIECARYIAGNYKNDEARMLLQVHDELLFEIKTDLAEKAAVELKAIMSGAMKLKVPIEVDVQAGRNWGELEKINI